MVEIVTSAPLDDLIERPRNYLSYEEDEVLLSFTHSYTGEVFYLMAGIDERSGSLYFVLEDDEQSEDIYCEDDVFRKIYCQLINHILSFQEGVFKWYT